MEDPWSADGLDENGETKWRNNVNDNDLTLEKMEINKRLSSLETVVNNWITTTTIKQKQDTLILEKLSHIVIGNGEIGLAENVRNLNTMQKNRENHVKVVFGAACVGVADFFNNHFFHWFK
jgi:predicted XRE-type DNA-binding protein